MVMVLVSASANKLFICSFRRYSFFHSSAQSKSFLMPSKAKNRTITGDKMTITGEKIMPRIIRDIHFLVMCFSMTFPI